MKLRSFWFQCGARPRRERVLNFFQAWHTSCFTKVCIDVPRGEQMKHLVLATLMFFISSAALADTFTDAKIDKVALDNKTMNLILSVRTDTPCDQIASPQLIQDQKNPTVYKIQALVRKATGTCIASEIVLAGEKHKIVSLPALMEVSAAKISKFTNYTFIFEGNDAVLIVPGNRLVATIQPEYQAE